jgi:putative PIG3 family NAD(P)H quinone oxidoreductase
MRAVVVDHPGDADVLRVEQVPDRVTRAGEILIRVAAAGVNRADVLQRRGFYPPPPGASDTLGLEVSGVVEALGDGVQGWARGDRVMALIEGGGYAELAAARVAQSVRVPVEVDLVEAAAVPEVFITAHDNLITRGRLQPGETVLIHGGAGGVGTAAIQLAKRRGCRVIVTARSDEKLRRCAELGADTGINYATQDFVASVLDATRGHGADVVLDVMGASYLERNIEALAHDGRIVIIAMQGGTQADVDLSRLNRKRASVAATHLRGRPAQQKAEIVAAFERDVVPGLRDRSLRPVIHRVLPLDEVQAAHWLLESGDVIGKVVLQVVAG